jgi:hypothetical protein
MLVLVAAGNSGACGSQDGTLTDLATAKNAISVGSAFNTWSSASVYFNTECAATYSSQGPTKDGRIKPDLMAPGHYLYSSEANSSYPRCSSIGIFPDSNGTNYPYGLVKKTGTSMACPMLASNIVIIRQYLMEGFYPTGQRTAEDSFLPSASLMKAMAIAGSINLMGFKYSTSLREFNQTSRPKPDYLGGNCTSYANNLPLAPRPSFTQGYGRLRLDQALYFNDKPLKYLHIPSLVNNSKNFFDASIDMAQTHTFSYCLYPDKSRYNETRIVLVWTDPPPAPLTSTQLVNNLDLIVSVRNVSIYGNSQGQAGQVWQNKNISRDIINNVEVVYVSAVTDEEQKIDITVSVNGSYLGQPPQLYSLVIAGNVSSGTCASSSSPQPPNSIFRTVSIPTPSPTDKPLQTSSPTVHKSSIYGSNTLVIITFGFILTMLLTRL